MDGFASAYSVWKKDPSYEFVPIQYGDDTSFLENYDEILMVDFSLKSAEISSLMDSKKVVVLDHHKSAENELESFLSGKNDDLKNKHNSDIVFCQDLSGCVISWMYFHGKVTEDGVKYDSFNPDSVPKLLRYIQDRDLWKWELEDSEKINTFISANVDFEKTSFQEFDKIVERFESNSHVFAHAGGSMIKYRDSLVDKICQKKEIVHLRIWDKNKDVSYEYTVPIVNSSVLQSEVGNKLSKGYPFSVVFFEDLNSEKIVYSLRSDGDNPNSIDVSEVAKMMGGGGHKNAAGFSEKHYIEWDFEIEI
jgi:oligoribonuclease NrnB/cAMP/cGMP phosphodiesterase (DHH superfamily)